jgi:hypothetical protein
MDFKEIPYKEMDGINLPEDRDQWRALEHSNDPSGSIKVWEFIYQLSDSLHLR